MEKVHYIAHTVNIHINAFMPNQRVGVLSVVVVAGINCHQVSCYFVMVLMEKGGEDFFVPTLLWIENKHKRTNSNYKSGH